MRNTVGIARHVVDGNVVDAHIPHDCGTCKKPRGAVYGDGVRWFCSQCWIDLMKAKGLG